jgi:hypothetical protein
MPVHQRRQSPLAELFETDPREGAFLMTAEDQAQDLPGQPAVEQAQLRSVGYMLEVVVENRYVADTVLDRLAGNSDESPRLLAGIINLLPSMPAAAKGKAEQVLDLPRLVARKRYLSPAAELQTQVAEGSRRPKLTGAAGWAIRQHKIMLVARLRRQLQFTECGTDPFNRRHSGFARRREDKQIVGIAEVAHIGNALDGAVESNQIQVRQDAGAGTTEGNADSGPVMSRLILVLESNSLREEFEEVVLRIDVCAS